MAFAAPCLGSILLALPALAGDPVFTPLVISGQATPAGPVNYVIDTAINNSGDWLVTCDLTSTPQITAELVLSGSGVEFTKGQLAPSPPASVGATCEVASPMMGLASDGTFSVLTIVDDHITPPSEAGILVGPHMYFYSNSQLSIAGFPAPSTLVGSGVPTVLSSSRMFVHVETDDVGLFGGKRNILLDCALDPATGTLLSATPAAQETDTIGSGKLYYFFQYSPVVNSAGQVAYIGQVIPNATGKPAYKTLVLDGQEVLFAGQSLPGLGNVDDIFRIDLNTSGQLSAHVEVAGVGGVILHNTTEVIREGGLLHGDPGLIVHTINNRPIFASDTNEVLWSGRLNYPTPSGQQYALFLDDKILVQEGVTIVDGATVTFLDQGQEGYAMSPNGRYVVFEAKLSDGRNGAFRIDRFPPFTNPVPGISGVFGCGDLAGDLEPAGGSIALGAMVQLKAKGAPSPTATALLFVADALFAPPCGLPLPPFGSLLLSPFSPNPLVTLVQPTSGLEATFSISVPAIPALQGVPVYAQALFADPGAATPLLFTTGIELLLGTI